MNIASAGRRIIDGIIDVILLFLFIILVSKYTGWGWISHAQETANNAATMHGLHVSTSWGGTVHGWAFPVLMLVGFIIFGLFEVAFKKTPGKWIAGTHVESLSGGPASFGQIMVRNILRFIDIIGFYLLGFIVLACTKNNQRVGDLCARTVVVND